MLRWVCYKRSNFLLKIIANTDLERITDSYQYYLVSTDLTNTLPLSSGTHHGGVDGQSELAHGRLAQTVADNWNLEQLQNMT